MKHLISSAIMSAAYFVSAAFAHGEAAASDKILLPVLLRQDQSKSLAEIQQIEEEQGFWKTSRRPELKS
ncbi:MAG: hypothetical protein ACR2G0_08600 [Chthoniobacterales bacterium]